MAACRDPGSVILRHRARDLTVHLAIKFKNCAQAFSHFCINSRTKNYWWRKEKLVVWSDK